MRSILLVASILVSTASFGKDIYSQGQYKFKGTWKDLSGSADVWTAEANLEKLSDAPKTVKLTQALQVYAAGTIVYSETFSLTFVETANGFFDVKDGEATVGAGYCLDRAANQRICHWTVENATEKGEETWAFVGGQVHNFGSSVMTGEDGKEEKVAYEGLGVRAEATTQK